MHPLQNISNTTLLSRFKSIIEHETHSTKRWKELEDLTGIPTHSWQKAFLGKQRPTSDMLEAISKKWPKYAFWLGTGLTDVSHGHISPNGEISEVKFESSQERIERLSALLLTNLPIGAQVSIKDEIEQLSLAISIKKNKS